MRKRRGSAPTGASPRGCAVPVGVPSLDLPGPGGVSPPPSPTERELLWWLEDLAEDLGSAGDAYRWHREEARDWARKIKGGLRWIRRET